MLIRKAGDLRHSDVTPKALYLRRREFILSASAAGLVAAAALLPERGEAQARTKLPNVQKSRFSTTETPTDYEDVTTFNNFYEFGSEKDEPAVNARRFVTSPWTIRVEGLCNKPGEIAYNDFVRGQALEERIYRMRCVEGWSMVIPWVGFPLGNVLKRFEPQPSARFVVFETLYAPDRMPGQRRPIIPYPYLEGLRMDEATHPLTILAVGLYGEVLPNQNGAPLRLVVPWKYGFKGIKSIVKIRFAETPPRNTWQAYAPREYGFYANVNPQVDHPRWSQATERRIGEFRRRDTLMFNGYADQVASLYAGMDLRRNF
jgi:sulfoxide reductase catalytic subunit YedY